MYEIIEVVGGIMKFYRKMLFNRVVLTGVSVLLQLLFLLNMHLFLADYYRWFYAISILLSVGCLLWIVYDEVNPAYKIAWIIPILLFPIFGGLLYVAFGGNPFTRKEKKKMKYIGDKTEKLLECDDLIINELSEENIVAANQSRYIQNYAPYPVDNRTWTEYYPSGELKYQALLSALKKAEKFILMEYFIIEDGKLWSSILEVLKEKVDKGVEVKLIYDDFGCSMKLPQSYHKTLNKMGIKTRVFNPLVPVLSSKYNTRDHRKIAVIDGHTAFTGGMNLADEYINEVEVYGHWKDAGIQIKGPAVWNFTVMFLTLWEYLDSEVDYCNYWYEPEEGVNYDFNGYVQPFSDNPLDGEPVGETVYLNLISKAKDYVYIMTPYLVIDFDMITALVNAAKSGVEVKIMTPHIPDKWYVQHLSRSYYLQLARAGVQILEYEPGFIHSKNFVVDDQYAVVGTINMDYRSLFLHYECGVWMYNSKSVLEVKKDFVETEKKCIKVCEDQLQKTGFLKGLLGMILRLFAPLM